MNPFIARAASALSLMVAVLGVCPTADARAILGTPTDEDSRIVLGTPTVIEVLCSIQQPAVPTAQSTLCETLGALTASELQTRCPEALERVSVEGTCAGDRAALTCTQALLAPLSACQ